MCDRAVGLAEADRRPVGAGRRDHEDRLRSVRLGQALVGARRGVAHHERALGVDEAAPLEQLADRPRQGEARLEAADPRHRDDARVGAAVRRRVEGDVEPIAGEAAAGPLRPFDEDERPVGRLLPTELRELGRLLDAEQVGVDDRELAAVLHRALVDLEEGEGRARHLEIGLADEIADEGAREGRLAGAEVAGQGDEIAGLDERGDVGGKRDRRRLVGDVDQPRRARARFLQRLDGHQITPWPAQASRSPRRSQASHHESGRCK